MGVLKCWPPAQRHASRRIQRHIFGAKLHLYAPLTEKAVYFYHDPDRPLAEMLFGLKAGSD